MSEYVLEARHIKKVFPGTTALQDVSVSFESGHVHAVLGKNGSGKSTLMKIFSGAYRASGGEVFLDGKKLELHSTEDAMKEGIVTVYQELSVIRDLTVAENLMVGKLQVKRFGRIDWPLVYRKAKETLDYLQIDLDTRAYVRDLTVGQQQLVEIAKAMLAEPKVLILDEPTSALSDKECENLFRVVSDLKKRGIMILFISHRLQEVFKIADKVTVLRDGLLAGTEDVANLDAASLVQMMFGNVSHSVKEKSYVQEETILAVEHFSNQKLKDVGLTLRKGEILGLAGMLGSGRTELLRAIYGLDKVREGKLFLHGKEIKRWNPGVMRRLGCGFTSENRKEEGLCQQLSVGDNLVLANLNEISPGKRVYPGLEQEFVRRQIEQLQIKVADYRLPVSALSGGNQQKVVVGNWLNTNPQVLLMDEPSRGIDVNAKQQIFRVMWKAASEGMGVIMVSSELEELLEVCDRILIMKNGHVYKDSLVSELNVELIYSLCMQEEAEWMQQKDEG